MINPFMIAGPVLVGNRYVDRPELLPEFRSMCGSVPVKSVLLYGQRCMGKSSFLVNAISDLWPEIAIVYIQLQQLSYSQTEGEILLGIIDLISDKLPHIDKPSDMEILLFPRDIFNAYLNQILRKEPLVNFILALDEYELFATLIKKGVISYDFLGYLAHLMDSYERLGFVFAGLNTLENLGPAFAQLTPHFTTLKVDFLPVDAVPKILSNAVPNLIFQSDAMERVYDLTAGVPQLIQAFGWAFTKTEINRRVSANDIDSIADDIAQSSSYTKIALRQVQQHRTEILELAQHAEGLPRSGTPDLAKMYPDIVIEKGDRYFFRVELLRRWAEHVSQNLNSAGDSLPLGFNQCSSNATRLA